MINPALMLDHFSNTQNSIEKCISNTNAKDDNLQNILETFNDIFVKLEELGEEFKKIKKTRM